MRAHALPPPALTLALDRRVARIVGTAIATAVVLAHGSGSRPLQLALLVFGMLATGLPHGAVDHRVGIVALCMTPLRFYLTYIAVMLSWALLWWWWPSAGIVGFLVASAWHFGEGDVRRWTEIRGGKMALVAWSRGLLVVGGLLYADGKISGAHLVPVGAPDVLTGAPRAMVLLLGLWAGFMAWSLAKTRGTSGWDRLMETLTLTGWFLAAEPTLAFALYFSLWHAPGHLRTLGETRAESTSAMQWFKLCGGYTVIAAAGMAVVIWWAAREYGLVALEGFGLAALACVAIPHIVLVEVWRQRRWAWWT